MQFTLALEMLTGQVLGQMYPLNIFFIILYTHIAIGEIWYSASIAENGRDPSKNFEFPFDEKFQTVPTIKRDSPTRHRWHFEKTEPSVIPPIATTNIPTNQTIKHNVAKDGQKWIGQINKSLFKRPVRQPNRKVVRKRCPSQPRKSKDLTSTIEKEERFLEVFEAVEFDRVSCLSSSGLEGACLHEYECEISGGTPMGACADDYATCCVMLLPCDSQSSAQSGWFTNPGFPSPSSDRLSCMLTLNKTTEDVVQIRLDFNTFELLPPTAGSCESDQFVVTGQNINNVVPILCGLNNGQHIYIEVGDVTGPIYLNVQTVTADNRLFSIKVSQLTAHEELSAPSGCLQYFQDSEGYLQSFNYEKRSFIDIARIPSYFNNLNYAMCIERASGSCSITYTNTEVMQIFNYDEDGAPVIPAGQAGVEIFNCPGDWLLVAATRLCGEKFNDGSEVQDFAYNAPVTVTASGPIVVWFKTDGAYVGSGFKLKYQQNNCTNL